MPTIDAATTAQGIPSASRIRSVMRLVMAEDHPLMRKGIRATLDGRSGIEIVAEASDGDEALRAVREYRPDLLLLDLSMPGLSPELVITQARENQSDLKILILTAHYDDVHLRQLSHLALSGYLLKDEAADHLLRAVQVIDQGAVWFSQSISDKMRDISRRFVNRDLLALSTRDREVLSHLGRGHDNKTIAEDLNLAHQTVRNYISRLYLKIGVSSRAEAMVWALEHDV